MTTAAELIDKAIEVINEKGWCRGVLENKQGQVCTLGALEQARFQLNQERAANEVFAAIRAYVSAKHAIGEVVAERSPQCSNIPTWNDVYAESADDVIEVLKIARENIALKGEQQ